MTREPERPEVPAEPHLRRARALGRTRAVVLILHGGKAVSAAPTAPWHLSVLRMVPFAHRIRRATLLRGVAVWRLRYRVRGWNGAAASPVADARWALAEIRRRHGDVPVVVLGHSMGARTGLHIAGDSSVAAVIALAPWLGPGDPPGAGGRLGVLHGDADRITSMPAAMAYARRAAAAGAEVTTAVIAGGEHFMLRRAMVWHALGSVLVRDALAAAGVGSPVRASRRDALLRRAGGRGPSSRPHPAPAVTGRG